MPRTPALLVLTGALALALTGCGDDGPPARDAASPAPASSTSAPAPTTSAPTTTAAPEPTASAAPTFPPEVVPEQGGTYVAVVLTSTRSEDGTAEAEAAVARVAEDGYAGGFGDVGCFEGAREGLGLPAEGDYLISYVTFADGAAAEQFVDAYEPGVVGTVTVKTFCLD